MNNNLNLSQRTGSPRQNILDWADNLKHFLSDNPSGFNEMNKSFREFYDMDILTALQQIKTDVEKISKILEETDKAHLVTLKITKKC